ncbi:MAG TPA: hypothetical protein VFT74_08795 [Isosphaeraceae bacterium]|nr:hypothetical protein [Isosphaeraceae bacterium]
MPRLKLLILDANIVILLHEFGIWPRLLERCEVYLARTVAEDEAVFFEQDGDQQPIDLSDDISNNRVSLFDVSIPDIKRFLDQFDPVYISKLDPGETESLAFLTQSKESFLISSGDAIVFRVLGRLNRGDQGISLEEILNKIGLQQSKLPWSCQKTFREKYTSEGGQDMIQGKGLKQS